MAREFNITRTNGQCAACERQLQPEEEFMATVRPAPEAAEEQFLREDFCTACWTARAEGASADPDVLALWRGRVPPPREKKKTFVDDDVLVNFFQRLEGTEDPARRDFRFVLGLVLMRKKLLIYDRSERSEDGCDVWTMHFRGDETPWHLVDPHLDEGRIAEVSARLGEILEADL